MADAYIGLDEPSTIDKKVRTVTQVIGPDTVHQGVISVADPTTGALIAGDAANGLDVDVTRVTGTVAISAAALPLPAGASTSALQTQPGVDIGDVTVNNGAGAGAVNIQDGGNAITVDGTVGVSGTVAISAASLPLPTGASTSALQTQPGVDIGDVTKQRRWGLRREHSRRRELDHDGRYDFASPNRGFHSGRAADPDYRASTYRQPAVGPGFGYRRSIGCSHPGRRDYIPTSLHDRSDRSIVSDHRGRASC